MKVKVTRRFTTFDNWTVWGLRFNIFGRIVTQTVSGFSKNWDRHTAKAALDLIEDEWQVPRKNIRFEK